MARPRAPGTEEGFVGGEGWGGRGEGGERCADEGQPADLAPGRERERAVWLEDAVAFWLGLGGGGQRDGWNVVRCGAVGVGW